LAKTAISGDALLQALLLREALKAPDDLQKGPELAQDLVDEPV
jgi:hypothetical protein